MNAPVFVLGTPRSGTTLVAKVLGRHSQIFMPGETDFFDDIYSRKKELGDPQDPEARQKIVARLATLYGRYNHSADQQRIEK
jgi:Sulfotransferase family